MCDQDAVLIYTTWPDAEQAAAAGEHLVARQLAACVNILAPATSIYMWQGKAERVQEVPMIIKTLERHVERVTDEIGVLHPFDVPAVAAVSISGGNVEFLAWIKSQTMA